MERIDYLNRKVLMIKRYISKKSAEQKELKRGFKSAEIQSEISRNKAVLKHQFWILAQAKANVTDYIKSREVSKCSAS